jgi:hypothetical protein
MHHSLVLMLAAVLLMAAEPAPPQLAVVFKDATVAMRAEWKGTSWKLVRDEVNLSLDVRATCERPVLRVEILRFEEISDGNGNDADVRTAQTNKIRSDHGRWWDDPDGTDLTTLTISAFIPIDRPGGKPPSIARIRGVARITVADGEPQTYILPIDGPQRQIPVGDTKLSIEVGRKAWGGHPVLGVPKPLVERLRSMTFDSGGRAQRGRGLNKGDVQLITLPLDPKAGDTVTLIAYPSVQSVELPFTIGPISFAPLLGDGPQPAATDF